ncbi:alpha-glucuronidase family glycosyl hydrolase [Actinopolymorpha sp. B17G11]|uniref:alpha-glucuronidase family glycosyl hydrolase n=1 Tax=Actinopolymorpha sp. B17G11 TaxID=3160861 RepID=UPI0032E37715
MPDLSRRTILKSGATAAAAGYLCVGNAGTAVAAPALAPAVGAPGRPPDEDGHELWLRYRRVAHAGRLDEYRRAIEGIAPEGSGELLASAVAELRRGFGGLLDRDVPLVDPDGGAVVLGTYDESPAVRAHVSRNEMDALGDEGYVIRTTGRSGIVIGASHQRGVLYGAFHLLRLLQTYQRLDTLDVRERPANPLRILNHWDDLDRNVERGYAGLSIFRWDALPELDPRYSDYARILASVGLNATVVNSVNANAQFLASERLPGLAALAGVLRAWGVRMFVSANYASPIVLTAGGADPITTADPFDARVQQWWQDKIAEIYDLIPDFGGFLVKANSEGQPGPLDYGRTHAEGANMLADRLRPYDGLLVWRSFVHEGFSDWAEYQYETFAPLDGDFADNAVVQTKNGPIDFQVREPVHPLFGAMPRTNQAIELQITQEYTGHEVHLCYLVPQWKEVLDFDTLAQGEGTTVKAIVGGAAYGQSNVGLIGVVNFGDDRDWTGYQLGAANTHGFARLAWNPDLSAEKIVTEWIRMTFTPAAPFVEKLRRVMLDSWRTYEAYTSPLGMGYLTFPTGSHFDPDPRSTLNQSHHTTTEGTGFDRSVATGSGFAGLYAAHWSERYESLETVPDDLLLFLHWVPYTHRLHSGTTVIQHIYDSHFAGYQRVLQMRETWRGLAGQVDARRHADILATFDDHVFHARRWRDAIVAYFFGYSRTLDERRGWLAYEATGGAPLLLGGWPNRLALSVTNGTVATHAVTARVDVPSGGWTSGTVSAELAAAATVEMRAPVQPPLVADQVPLGLTVTPDVELLGNAGQPAVVVPAGRRCHVALDAGSGSSPLVPGYQRLTPQTSWDPTRAYGWVGRSPQERDRGGAWDAARRDFCGDTAPATLRLAIPAGVHEVSILVGDGGPDVWPTFVDVDGVRIAEGGRIRGGTFEWLHADLDGGGSGREVDLAFSSVPGRFWRLCALVIIDHDSVVPPAVVTDVRADGVWFGGRPNEVTVTVAGTTPDAPADVTITVDVPDGWSVEPAPGQVPPGDERTFVAVVTPPSPPALATVAVRIEGDAEAEKWPLDVVSVPAADEAVLALDAGSPTSPVLDGYTRLSPAETWDAGRGFGWVGEPPDFRDRARMDVLRRDIVLGRDQDYVLRVAVPAGPHRVHILTGDAFAPSGTTTVYEGDTELGSSGPEIIPQAEFRWFSFVLDGGTPGRLADLRLVGSLRDGYWRVAALVMQGE